MNDVKEISKNPELVRIILKLKEHNARMEDLLSVMKNKLNEMKNWDVPLNAPIDEKKEHCTDSFVEDFEKQVNIFGTLNERLNNCCSHIKELI